MSGGVSVNRRRKREKSKPMVITQLKMSDGRIVTDPVEVRRLLRADGFIVDEDTGAVTVGPLLRPQ